MPAIVARRSALILGLLASLLCCGLAAAAQEIRMAGVGCEGMSDAALGQGAAIVVVWASWSPRSRDIVERVRPLAGRWSPRARVLTVDFEEERPAVEAFLAGRSLGAPTYLDSDGAFSKKYAIATLPGLLVIKDGKTVYHGKLPDDPDQLLADLLR